MPSTHGTFVARSRELSEISEICDRPGPALGILYGRPFVGKTRLLRKKSRSERFFYYLAGGTTPERNRREFVEDFDASYEHADLSTSSVDWRTTIAELLQLAESRPDGLVVLFDEAQHILGDRDVQTEIAEAWPDDESGPNLTLIAVGTGYDERAVLGGSDAPLADRIDRFLEIAPFDYLDAGRMTPERPAGQKAYLYGIFGGRPGLISSIDAKDTLGEAIRRNVLAPDSAHYLRLSTLLERVPTIRDPTPYRSVLVAVAEGNSETNEIARAAGLEDRKTMARRTLETLGDLGFVRRRRDFRAGARAAWQNRIADPAVHFWHRFVHAHRAAIDSGAGDRVWSDRIVDELDEFMQEIFEQIVEQGFRRFHDRWDLPAPAHWRRWSGRDLSGRPVEIDIAAELEGGDVLTGRIVWSSEPAEYDLHFQLKQDLEALKHLGESWADAALSEETSHGHVYVSAGGFTDYFRNRSRMSDRIRLVTLHDLYPES